MIKTLGIMSVLAVALAAVLIVFSVVVFGAGGDKDIEELLGEPGVIEKFNNSAGNKATRGTNEVSPLVQQAGAFALYLNPPKPKAPRPMKGRSPSIKRAPSASPKFKVLGTSYYKGRPESSLAFIDEPGKGLHWVRQGSKVGHLLIQEVKDGIVVIKDNNGTFELKAEETPQISLLAGAPAVSSKKVDVSRSPAKKPVSGSSSAASSKPSSRIYSGKTGSRYVKPRPPLPRKTNDKRSAMTELTEKLAQLQKSFKSDKSGTGPSAQEKAEMMNKLISDFQASKSSRLSAEESERLSILGKELRKKMKEPTSSGQK
ncbi:MAG: hypothetical protein GY845_38625 [Planctomycetes bacterium]|nr:hypothetical protein [Planctomycetota bacterium]